MMKRGQKVMKGEQSMMKGGQSVMKGGHSVMKGGQCDEGRTEGVMKGRVMTAVAREGRASLKCKFVA